MNAVSQAQRAVNIKAALHPTDRLVSSAGGFLDVVSPDGEIVAQVAVPPGKHLASGYLALLEPGLTLQVGDGLAVFPRRSLCAVTNYPDDVNRASDANPDWKPTSATAMETQLRAMIFRRREQSTRTERRAAALASLEAARVKAEEEAAAKAAQEKADADARAAAAQAERDALAAAIAKAAKAEAVVE